MCLIKINIQAEKNQITCCSSLGCCSDPNLNFDKTADLLRKQPIIIIKMRRSSTDPTTRTNGSESFSWLSSPVLPVWSSSWCCSSSLPADQKPDRRWSPDPSAPKGRQTVNQLRGHSYCFNHKTVSNISIWKDLESESESRRSSPSDLMDPQLETHLRPSGWQTSDGSHHDLLTSGWWSHSDTSLHPSCWRCAEPQRSLRPSGSSSGPLVLWRTRVGTTRMSDRYGRKTRDPSPDRLWSRWRAELLHPTVRDTPERRSVPASLSPAADLEEPENRTRSDWTRPEQLLIQNLR